MRLCVYVYVVKVRMYMCAVKCVCVFGYVNDFVCRSIVCACGCGCNFVFGCAFAYLVVCEFALVLLIEVVCALFEFVAWRVRVWLLIVGFDWLCVYMCVLVHLNLFVYVFGCLLFVCLVVCFVC